MSLDSELELEKEESTLHVLPEEWYTSDGSRVLNYDDWRPLHFVRHQQHARKHRKLIPNTLARKGEFDPTIFTENVKEEREWKTQYETEVKSSTKDHGLLFTWIVEILLAKNPTVFRAYVQWLHAHGYVLLAQYWGARFKFNHAQ